MPDDPRETDIPLDMIPLPRSAAAQQAAIANGQTVKWDQQGITWTLPPNWKKSEVRNESFTYSGDGAFLTVAISPLPQMKDIVDISSKAMYEAAKTNQKIGKYDEVRWLELDGLKGVGFRESKQEMAGDAIWRMPLLNASEKRGATSTSRGGRVMSIGQLGYRR